MNQILRCDWLPKMAKWRHHARSGLLAASRKKKFPMINPLLIRLFGQGGWILASFLFLRVYGPRLRLDP